MQAQRKNRARHLVQTRTKPKFSKIQGIIHLALPRDAYYASKFWQSASSIRSIYLLDAAIRDRSSSSQTGSDLFQLTDLTFLKVLVHAHKAVYVDTSGSVPQPGFHGGLDAKHMMSFQSKS